VNAAVTDARQVIAALSGLKHDLRLAVYRGLVQAGNTGMTPGSLSRQFGIPPSSLSFHLKEMCYAKLIVAVQEGRSINYSVNRATMMSVIAYLTENCC
jgi:DNA-binding transcriptional ArsR family regulator